MRRKYNGRYYITYTEYTRDAAGVLRGKQVERAAGTDKAQAQEEENRLRRFWQCVKLGRTPPATFDDLIESFLAAHEGGPSYASQLSNARQLYSTFAGRLAADIHPADIRAYAARRTERGAAPSTVNHEIQLLSAAITRANTLHNWNIANPCTGCRVKPRPPRVRWLSADELARLLDAAVGIKHAPLLVHWILLAINTGMRYREITELEWCRVDLGLRLIHLEPAQNKSRRRRSVPLNKQALQTLADLRTWHAEHGIASPRVFVTKAGKPLKQIGRRSFKSACISAGIPDLTPRDTRHIAATNMLRAGATLEQVKAVLGHQSISTTEIYAHFSPQHARDAVGALDGMDLIRMEIKQTA